MSAAFRDVAILGAGIAGLAAGQALQAAGLRLQLYDKSRSVGGRLCTRRGDDWEADHGAQYFTARDPDFGAQVQRWVTAGVLARWQPRLVALGGDGGHRLDVQLPRYVGTPRMGAPARQLSQGLAVQTQTTVDALQRSAGRWRLHSREQGWSVQDFDAVLLALPAPQAAVLLGTCDSTLAQACSAVDMRGCWALMLRFANQLDPGFDAAFVNDGPLSWVARNSSKPQRSGLETWVVQASPTWSQSHIEASSEEVIGALLPEIIARLGVSPDAVTAHRWRYADCAQAAQLGSLWSASEQLGVCGDWLHGGRVEGAWLSGRHLARQAQRP